MNPHDEMLRLNDECTRSLNRWRRRVERCRTEGKHATKLVRARATERNEWPADKFFCKFCRLFVRYAEGS